MSHVSDDVTVLIPTVVPQNGFKHLCIAPALKCSYFKLQTVITRMRGKAQRDGRPAVKWMETFTRDMMGKVRV